MTESQSNLVKDLRTRAGLQGELASVLESNDCDGSRFRDTETAWNEAAAMVEAHFELVEKLAKNKSLN